MKKNTLFILGVIPIILIALLSCYSLLLNNNLKECNTNNENITTQDNENIQNSVSVNIYNCQFTVTYRIVDLLEDYTTNGADYSYIVVDKYQDNNPIVHLVPTDLKVNLEINKFYEFTYTVKGTGNIDDIYDVINNINSSNDNNLNVTLSIKGTTKTGLGQIQESICK